jgi:DNA polymerase/3'-5' exonuclease PolX
VEVYREINTMKLIDAQKLAEELKQQLAPHCYRVEIAGSIRRKKPEPNDIELVAIPRPYNVGIFECGIAKILNQYEVVKGILPCKYTQRVLPGGIKLDFFTATPDNWGLIYAIRTGSAEFSHNVLASGWVRAGYKSIDGYLHNRIKHKIPVREEKDLFDKIGIKYVEPENRN